MWIQTKTPDAVARLDLLCDECGAIFHGTSQGDDRRAFWREANIAGWVKTSRIPERHVCANC